MGSLPSGLALLPATELRVCGLSYSSHRLFIRSESLFLIVHLMIESPLGILLAETVYTFRTLGEGLSVSCQIQEFLETRELFTSWVS